MTELTLDRFWSKVNKTDSCWLWTSTLSSKNYGQFKLDGKMQYAHRVAYKMLVGPIPKGLTIDHLCRVRNCVNPKHLEPVTQRENTLRGNSPTAINAQKTHCINGHELSENNLYKSSPGRRCITCAKEWARANQ